MSCFSLTLWLHILVDKAALVGWKGFGQRWWWDMALPCWKRFGWRWWWSMALPCWRRQRKPGADWPRSLRRGPVRFVLEPQLPGRDRQASSVLCNIGGFKEVTPARFPPTPTPALSSTSWLDFCFPDLSVVLVFSCEENHLPQFCCYLFWEVR